MKITVLSDIHADLDRLTLAAPILRDGDALVVSGDLSAHGDLQELRDVIRALQAVQPVLMVIPGNMDGPRSVDLFKELGVNIHGQVRELDGVGFAGAGASTPTPFGTPFELPEADIVSLLASGFDGCTSPRRVAVCHTPPHGTRVDRILMGRHVGGRQIRAWIETHQPDVFLSGHIHEAPGVDRLGETVLLNPGPFRRGGVGIVEIPEKGPAIARVVRV